MSEDSEDTGKKGENKSLRNEVDSKPRGGRQEGRQDSSREALVCR